MDMVTGAQVEMNVVELGAIGSCGGMDWSSGWRQIAKSEEMQAAEDHAELAGKLIGHAATVDEVRWELVARLQKEIAAGTYRVDAHEVAGSILRSLGAAA